MIRPARFLLALGLATALVLFWFPTAAAVHNNQGTVKVHDNEDEDPDTRNVPHVDCEFWIEGFNMGDDSGWIVFYGWPPTGDKEIVWSGEEQNWTADASEEHSHHFLAGPFTLPSGHYRVEVYTDAGHPGATPDGSNPHFAKTKTFWVECEETPVVNPPCPPGLNAVATTTDADTPVVHLTWDAVAGADGYLVYRAVGGGEFELAVDIVDLVTDTQYFDHHVEAGTTYEYYVTAVIGDAESENCEIVEVTAIPFFPQAALGALALLGSVGALMYFRRRS